MIDNLMLYQDTYVSTIIIPNNVHFIEHFLQIKRNRSEYTARNYETAIKEFFKVDSINKITLEDIRKVDILDAEVYINELTKLGYASSTINNRISALSSLYRWLLKYNDNNTGKFIIRFNPFANLKEEKPKIVLKRPTKYLETSDMSRLVKSINTDNIIGLRNRTIISLLFTTALRKSEIINAKIGHIENVQGYYVLRTLQKGSKIHYAKIVPEVKALLDLYLARTGRTYIDNADDYIFINHSNNKNYYNKEKLSRYALNKMLKAACINARVPVITVHGTRHSAITSALDAGVPIQQVKENLANHKNIETTMRYVHVRNSMKNNPSDAINIF